MIFQRWVQNRRKSALNRQFSADFENFFFQPQVLSETYHISFNIIFVRKSMWLAGRKNDLALFWGPKTGSAP